MPEAPQPVSGRARIPRLCLASVTQAPAHPRPSDDVPHLGHLLAWSQHASFQQVPWERDVKERRMGTRREAQNGCLRVQGQMGSGSPRRLPHVGSARPGRLLATGTDTSASLAVAVFISRARQGAVSRWGSVERVCSHTLLLKLPSAVPQEQSPIQRVQ